MAKKEKIDIEFYGRSWLEFMIFLFLILYSFLSCVDENFNFISPRKDKGKSIYEGWKKY
jgi:hypothetical protein